MAQSDGADGGSFGGAPVRDATWHLVGSLRGDEAARGALLELVYVELRDQARAYLAGERAAHTLQPTALVHEAWVRLVRADGVELESRGHFLALAARAMKQVLVDHARARAREKRGGGARRIELESGSGPITIDADGHAEELVDLAAGLEALRKVSPRKADVVDLRFFGGLSKEETAEALGISRNTVDREWRAARAWLAARLDDATPA